MRARYGRIGNASSGDQIEISDAAIASYKRLRDAVRGRLVTHAAGDGGLICEERTHRARPTIWRVAPDGAVLPDRPYNFALRTFITAGLPSGVS
jgi:hypothetical protein